MVASQIAIPAAQKLVNFDELIAVRDALTGLVILIGQRAEVPNAHMTSALIDCIVFRLEKAIDHPAASG